MRIALNAYAVIPLQLHSIKSAEQHLRAARALLQVYVEDEHSVQRDDVINVTMSIDDELPIEDGDLA